MLTKSRHRVFKKTNDIYWNVHFLMIDGTLLFES